MLIITGILLLLGLPRTRIELGNKCVCINLSLYIHMISLYLYLCSIYLYLASIYISIHIYIKLNMSSC